MSGSGEESQRIAKQTEKMKVEKLKRMKKVKREREETWVL